MALPQELSAAQIRASQEPVTKDQEPLTTIPLGRLSELQIHELFKTARNKISDKASADATIQELAVYYHLDTATVQRLLQHVRLPHFTRNEEDPEISIAR